VINEYDIWFSNIEISNKEKIKLLEKLKNSQIIWTLTEKELLEKGIKEQTINKVLEEGYRKKIDKYKNYLERNKIKLICVNSKEYPESLKHIDNKPAYLYVRGKLENLYDDNVAIVGSRKASTYGKFISRKISKEIADRNVNIVSGLAIGIDKYAHLGALDSGYGKTIAVLGTGVSDNEIYPLENKKVFERILENNGTVVSEFKLGTKPEKYNFPLRNRIISGLAKKIIVVEAKEKSGSLITVDYALEQGKDVFAIPGNITSQNSVGTNKLIEEGACMLTKIDDLFVE